MAIDTHCHIFDEAFNLDRMEVINRITENKISKAIVVGYNNKTNKDAYELALKYPFLYNTAGIHPDQATNYTANDLDILEEFIKTHKVYAIGECGLDYYWVKDNIDKQKELFEAQIKLAIKYDLPLVIHSRDAIYDTYELLSKYKGMIKFVMHCYSSSKEMAFRFIELGGMISLGGPVTFKNAKVSKEVAKNIPLDKLMVETDCPYLAPMPFRGKRNEPAFVQLVIEEIAKIREIDSKEVERITDENAIKFFNLK